MLLQLEGGVGALRGLARVLVDAAVPASVAELLGAASLFPLAKPGGGIRPLAVGEAFRRLTSRALCLQLRDSFREDLAPHQDAVALGAGCGIVRKSVAALAECSWGSTALRQSADIGRS